MLHQPSGRKGPPPQRRKSTKKYDQIEPSSSQTSPTLWGNHCGSDNRDCHTHTTSQDHCALSVSQHNWHLAVYQAPTSQLCGHARRRSTPTPRGQTQTTHPQPGSSCCVPLCDPHAQKGTRSNETKQECNHNNANTLVPVHHRARTHQTDDKSKGQKKDGCMEKGFCAKTDLCPLASPRVALVGVACSGTPTMATRGEARGHP